MTPSQVTETIPEEIWSAAEQAISEMQSVPDVVLPSDADVVIARALLRERERCAKVADPITEPDGTDLDKQAYDIRLNIATAIRRGQP